MKRFMLIFTLIAFIPVVAFGIPQNTKIPAPIYPVATGNEVMNPTASEPAAPQVPVIDEVDLVGDTFTLGMSWYDIQHNGTCGRMNTTETNGWKQFAWMKGENSGASIRHIWWNGIDPNGFQVFPGNGVAVESSIKGGYTTFDVYSNGAGIPAYHNVVGSSTNPPQTAISVDLIPYSGAFLDFQAPVAPIDSILWPHMQIGQNGRIHIVCSNQVPAAAIPQKEWYISATYNPTLMTVTYDPVFTAIDWTQTIAVDVATSPVVGSNKTLWAWTRSRAYVEPEPGLTYSQLNNDVYYLIDDDGLNPNFANKVNLTNFIPPDLSLLPDTALADRDTLRVYTCLNTFIDHNNYAHIVFTTRSYFQLENTSYWNASLLWHWSQQYPDSFRIVGGEEYFAYNNNVSCGVWNVKAQRPCLGEASNGYLYCMYQVYDTDTMRLSDSPDYKPSGEIYISVSTNGGLNWSRGRNVTETFSPYNAALGQCLSEITPSMAKKVDTYCHIQYILDLDAGTCVQTEGGWTNNPVRYHRVPVSMIPTTPLVNQTKRLHVQPITPAIDVTMIPINPPIIIPANGGQFSFNAQVRRTLAPQAAFWAWGRIKNPDGSYTTPNLGPVQINPPVGVLVQRMRTTTVPNTWVAGTYYSLGYANLTVSYPAIDADSFSWVKSPTANGGPLVWEASCTGEPFPYEVTPASSTPQAFTLDGAYPNPFNPTTSISFTLPEAAHVNLTVFDLNGREVTTLVNGQRDAGRYSVTFDASNLSSGVYFYTLTAGANVATGKMALVK